MKENESPENDTGDFSEKSLKEMSYHELGSLRSLVIKTLRGKYPASFKRSRKYGTLRRALSREELRRFFSAVRHPNHRVLYSLMAFCGLRVSEAVSVKLADINFERRSLTVRSKKTDIVDELPLSQGMAALLSDYISGLRRDTIYLFETRKGKHMSPNNARNKFRDIAQRAGLIEAYGETPDGRILHKFTTHSLRKFYASTVYRNCRNEKIVQKLLRHTDNRSVGIYINLDDGEMREAVEKAFD